MPNYHDFANLSKIKEVRISPFGWVNPIFVEYAIGNDISGDTYYWRVKGTKHTFSILVNRLNYLSSGNYEHHFTEVLEKFREDYIDWQSVKKKAGWIQEYLDEYSRFIT